MVVVISPPTRKGGGRTERFRGLRFHGSTEDRSLSGPRVRPPMVRRAETEELPVVTGSTSFAQYRRKSGRGRSGEGGTHQVSLSPNRPVSPSYGTRLETLLVPLLSTTNYPLSPRRVPRLFPPDRRRSDDFTWVSLLSIPTILLRLSSLLVAPVQGVTSLRLGREVGPYARPEERRVSLTSGAPTGPCQ